jgi:hypothetical protein
VHHTQKLKNKFREWIGMDIPPSMLPKVKVFRAGKEIGENLLYGSSVALERLPRYLTPAVVDLLRGVPDGLYLAGFWGYGVNSYAFYYCVVDSWRQVFFRLSYGGAYSDTGEDAAAIRAF